MSYHRVSVHHHDHRSRGPRVRVRPIWKLLFCRATHHRHGASRLNYPAQTYDFTCWCGDRIVLGAPLDQVQVL